MSAPRSTEKGVPYQVAKRQISVAIRANRPLMLWGPPGIGKSALAKELAAQFNKTPLDIRLSLINPIDLRGCPHPDLDARKTVWFPPEFLPQDPGYLIIFDEINSAPQTVQTAAYQLILDRKCGEYTLPDDCYILCCGNRNTDRGVTYEMPAPLRNRMCHLELGVNFAHWKVWAQDHNVDPRVIAFLQSRPEYLFQFDPAVHSRGFPTPRSWEIVSDLLHQTDSLEEIMDLIEGTIGDGTAVEFTAFCHSAFIIPDVEPVLLEGKNLEVNTDDPSVAVALVSKLVYTLNSLSRDHDKLGLIVNFIRYVRSLSMELCMLASKDAARLTLWQEAREEFVKTPECSDWANMVGEVLF